MPQDLTPEQRTQLDNNIKSMLANGASQEDVMSYATDFNAKYNLQKKNSLNGGGAESNPFLNAQKPTGNISNEDVLAAQQHQGTSTEQKLVADYGQKLSQGEQEKKKKDIQTAAINSATQYFQNNPYTLKELSKKNKDISLKDAEGKEVEGEYSIKHLQKTSLFDKKVAELTNGYNNGELTTYAAP